MVGEDQIYYAKSGYLMHLLLCLTPQIRQKWGKVGIRQWGRPCNQIPLTKKNGTLLGI